MKERPILMSAPMVRAILDDTKTQTRRVVKQQPPAIVSTVYRPFTDEPNNWHGYGADAIHWYGRCPYGAPGDRLWVRETWNGPLVSVERWESVNSPSEIEKPEHCRYAADGGNPPEYLDADENLRRGWRPSIFMPRWASRITLEVTGVRVERLQDISEADAISEGVTARERGGVRMFFVGTEAAGTTAAGCYQQLWASLNGPGSWDANPWVWVVEFERIEEGKTE